VGVVMTLQSQHIEIPLVGGVSTKEAEQAVQIPKLLRLENADMSEPGKIRRRAGSVLIDTTQDHDGTAMPAAYDALIASESQLALASGGHAHALGEDGEWYPAGEVESIKTTASTVFAQEGFTTARTFAAYAAGKVAYAFRHFSAHCRVQVYDHVTGALLIDRTFLNVDDWRIVALGSTFLLLRREGTNLIGSTADATALSASSFPTGTTLSSGAMSSPFDVCVGTHSGQPHAFVSAHSASASAIRIWRISSALAVAVQGQSHTPPSAMRAITIEWRSQWNRLVVAWSYDGGSVRTVDAGTDLTFGDPHSEIVASSVVDNLTITQGPSSSEAVVFYEVTASDTRDRLVRHRTFNWSTRAVSGTVHTLKGYGLAHKAWDLGEKSYVGIAYQSGIENVFLEAVWPRRHADQRLQLAAKFLSPTAGGLVPVGTLMPVAQTTTGRYLFACVSRFRVRSSGSGIITTGGALAKCEMDTRLRSNWSSTRSGGLAYVAGSVPHLMDTGRFTDVGFPHAPPPPNLTLLSSGSLAANSAYSYVMVYEWRDDAGRMHRSPPSVPSTVNTGASGGEVEIRHAGLLAGPNKLSGFKRPLIAIFRTLANQTVYFRIDDTALYADQVGMRTLGGVDVFEDNFSDANISSHEILYTTGGELDHYAPPPTAFMVNHQERLWAIHSEDGTIWPSALLSEHEGAWWHQGLSIETQRTGKIATALASMDDKLIVFWDDAIAYLYGDGPANNGQGGVFSPLIPVPSDVGCIEPRSVITTPQGVFFQSSRGIYLLGRDMQAQYIGADVEDFTSGAVEAATLSRENHEVRFEIGRNTLVYDYLMQQWWVNTLGEENKPIIARDATVYRGAYYLLSQDANVSKLGREDTSAVVDLFDGSDGEPFDLSMRTPWLAMSGIAGFQRVRRVWVIGTFPSDRESQINVYVDAAADASATRTFTGVGSEEAVMLHVPTQKCRSLQVEVIGANQVLRIRLEIGVKRGAYKPVHRRL
jgi:hypothetical protein